MGRTKGSHVEHLETHARCSIKITPHLQIKTKKGRTVLAKFTQPGLSFGRVPPGTILASRWGPNVAELVWGGTLDRAHPMSGPARGKDCHIELTGGGLNSSLNPVSSWLWTLKQVTDTRAQQLRLQKRWLLPVTSKASSSSDKARAQGATNGRAGVTPVASLSTSTSLEISLQLS